MDPYIKKIQQINTISGATAELNSQIELTTRLKEIIDFTIEAHEGQFRKSGEPYAVHPLLVASIIAHFSGEEPIVASALLHDVVEDTKYDLNYIKQRWGEDISYIVDGLTKIDEIREHELLPSTSNKKLITSALSFRKLLIASIDDPRVLVVKLCDRLHNMLTLSALPSNKQFRIAEETLVVYVPIAHRLGISTIKNVLEDLAFFYIYPNEYKKIDDFMKEHQQSIQVSFNEFISSTKILLEKNGYDDSKIKIYSRVKHYYSIYMKMQRKGVNIEEVLDLMAIRILVNKEIDCYKVLGHIHLEYNPLIARFKDYIATPKENGYQTIHTTVFYNSKIHEVQIRTNDMHKVAEYGIAAHWKYKGGAKHSPNLNWLKSLEYSNENIEEFYSETKEDLYSEDMVIYSPRGDTFTLPRNATAYDYAYMIHTDVGNSAIDCHINKVRKPLLTELQSSDIVSINTTDHPIPRCSWIDMVKTTRAKKQIKILCTHREKELDEYSGKNILNTVFSKYRDSITELYKIDSIYRVPQSLDFFKHTKKVIEKKIRENMNFVARLKMFTTNIKESKFENILIYSNFSINAVSFEHCCHPKFGDDIVAFKEKNRAVIHHKMCDHSYKKIKAQKQMLFCKWIENKLYQYKMVVSLPNTKGELARLLMHMSQYEGYILSIDYGRETHSYVQYCDIEFEINKKNRDEVRKLIEKKVKVIEFFSKKDAYNKK